MKKLLLLVVFVIMSSMLFSASFIDAYYAWMDDPNNIDAWYIEYGDTTASNSIDLNPYGFNQIIEIVYQNINWTSGYPTYYLTVNFSGTLNDSRTEFVTDDEISDSFMDWYEGNLERLATGEFMPAITGHGSSDPVVGNTIRSFKNVIFSERVQPNAKQKKKKEKEGKESEGEDEGKGSAVKIKSNDVNSDLQYEFFSINKVDGNSLNIRGNLTRTHYDWNLNYGGNLNINSLSYKNGPDFSNFYLGFFAKRPIVEKETSTINAGVNFDLMFFDKDYIDATGTGISLFVSGKDTKGFEFMTKKFSGTHLFSWGGMLTFSNADKQSQTLMNGGASYGVPIGEKLTTTLDMFGTFILASSYDGHDLDIDDPFMLNSGVYCSYLLSSLFNLNFGLKKVFFVEDFSSTELTLGANYRF